MGRQLGHSEHKPELKYYPLSLLADNIDTPMNVGSFFRIADALGVEKIYLTGRSIVPPNRKLRKTSRASEQFVDYQFVHDARELIHRLREQGYRMISLEITSDSVDIQELSIAPTDKICLILGSENAGVSQDLLDQSDISVHIPMRGVNSSMNVANACAIAVYEITKKMNRKPCI